VTGERRSTKALRVLLFSPVHGRDAPGGDIIYTESLVAEPPPGVEYTTYDQALDRGQIVVRGRRPRRGRVNPMDLPIFLVRALDALPRGRVAFREAPWFISFTGDDFDLVHQHLFGVAQMGHRRLPSISSAGFPLAELYGSRELWSYQRTRLAEAYQFRAAKVLRAHVPGYHSPPDGLMTVYTEHYRRYLRERGIREPVRVVGQALPQRTRDEPPSATRTIAFIGRDFERKGGHRAVAAFRLLRDRGLSLRLIVVTAAGAAPPDIHDEPGVVVHLDLARHLVLQQILPATDVLVLPTSADCGTPYAVIEALQCGAGVVVTRNPWLSERLAGPPVVRTDAGVSAIADGVDELLGMPREMRRDSANALYAREYSMAGLHADLLAAYQSALATSKS
jgi:glycosyltransferase involved in cell wall biosynthesis